MVTEFNRVCITLLDGPKVPENVMAEHVHVCEDFDDAIATAALVRI